MCHMRMDEGVMDGVGRLTISERNDVWVAVVHLEAVGGEPHGPLFASMQNMHRQFRLLRIGPAARMMRLLVFQRTS